jgi:GT2 family glycosyltransferase
VERTTVALLVLNWNGAHLLRRHLPQVVEAARAASVPARAYVVDNASEDDSFAVVEQFPEVGWLPMPANLKLVAYNHAARQLDCDAFMVLNNDLSPPANAVDGLWPTLRDNSDVFAVGGLVRNTATGETDSGPTALRWEGEWNVHANALRADDKPINVGYVSGGASLIRRQMFLELDGFWELLPSMYWEDVELGLHAWLHGWRSLFDPRLVFEHETGATTSHSMSTARRSFGVYRNRRLGHVSLLLDGDDLRAWIKAELRRSVRKPYYWPAALTLIPRLREAIRRRRRLRARLGPVSVAELQRRWSSHASGP